ncbi:MAG: M14 family zinc carboxypeptidase [Nonlabens sp.]
MILSRYYTYSTFEKALGQVLLDSPVQDISQQQIGKSIKGRSIYGLKLGRGKTRVLIWSQMHGNESTTTRALLQLLSDGLPPLLLNDLKLHIIPVLNPDGAENWTRVNALGIDLNRDAVDLSQPESKVLRHAFDNFKPHYCLNLHGQRTIYGNLEGTLPAQLSFLAPAGDTNKSITEARLKSMHLINTMVHHLNIENAVIGRYSDTFNRNCVGDFFTSQGVPTLLFEAGHAGQDYSRELIRYYIKDALQNCLLNIPRIEKIDLDPDKIIEEYESIPNIAQNYVDILIKNLPDESGARYDLSVLYIEEVHDEVLYFLPMVAGINDKSVLNAHRVIDARQFNADLIDFKISENGIFSSTTFEIDVFCE